MDRCFAIARLIGLGAIFAVAVGSDGVNAQLPAGPSCSYVEAGPAGPAGNLLQVQGADRIYRSGNKIKVSGAICDGGIPTVANVDRIDIRADRRLTVDESRGGLLAPGATPESQGSEIEMRVDFEQPQRAALVILGTRRPNVIEGKSLAHGRIGLNLDRRADGSSPDLDLISPRSRLSIIGSRRRDRISGAGFSSFSKDLGPKGFFTDGLVVKAREGADVVLGSPGSDFWLGGGGGKDLIRGGRGDDDIRIGNGSATAYGGPGNDDVFHQADVDFDNGHDLLVGGRGNDQIFAANFLVDTVRCGPGRDRVVRDRSDRVSGCERNVFLSFCETSNACRSPRESPISRRRR